MTKSLKKVIRFDT